MTFPLAELDRRLANLLRHGTIAAVNETHPDGPRATVALDDNTTTDWLAWITLRAGPDATWWAPEPGEQVMVLSPSGELSVGRILPGVPSDAFPAVGNTKEVQRTVYKDGTIVEYDRVAHQLKVDASASNGAVLVDVGTGSVTVNCATAVVHATTSVAVTTLQATVTASTSVTLDTPTVHCTHDLQVDGNATVTGTITGGTIVTAGGIGLAAHHHTAQGPTAPTTAAQA
jgi:phage baseplate assembly protein V